jgi:hypothetical protein
LKDDSAKALPVEAEDSDSSSEENKLAASEQCETGASQITFTLGVTGKENGEEYCKPLSIARPRTNSGSRYLTDKV